MRNRSIQLGRLHFHHTLLDWIGRWPLGVLAFRRRVLYVNDTAAHLLGGERRRDLIAGPLAASTIPTPTARSAGCRASASCSGAWTASASPVTCCLSTCPCWNAA